jgi:hypothetical protein
MANRKISDLTALTAPATGDLLPIVDISEAAAADKNKKITYGELLASAPAGSAAAPSFSFDGDPNTGIFNPAADTLAFAEGGSEVMRIDSSGRLLVGASTPTFEGDFEFRRNVNISAFHVFANGDGTANNVARLDLINNTSRASFIYAGNGLTVQNGGVGGVVLAFNATAWAAASDERTKTDLEPITDGLDKVGSLRAVTGRYKTDEVGTSRSFLIAQDVQAVLPEAVSGKGDETLSLRYTEVIPLFVAALKESKERIENLEARLTAAGIA